MKTKKTLIIIVAAAAVTVSAAAILLVNRRPSMPKPDISDPNKIEAYFKSEQFQKLDPNERMKYGGEIMRKMLTARVQEYFLLPEDQRTAYLDKIIDNMQARRKEFEAQRKEFDANSPDARQMRERMRREFRPERMRQRSESIPPQTRAQMAEFFKAMHRRAMERGIRPQRPGR